MGAAPIRDRISPRTDRLLAAILSLLTLSSLVGLSSVAIIDFDRYYQSDSLLGLFDMTTWTLLAAVSVGVGSLCALRPRLSANERLVIDLTISTVVAFTLYFVVPVAQLSSEAFGLTEPRHLGSALFLEDTGIVDPHVSYLNFPGSFILLASTLLVTGADSIPSTFAIV